MTEDQIQAGLHRERISKGLRPGTEPLGTSLVAQMITYLPAVQETQVRSLGREDSPGEGHGNPLQYSCLEKPMVQGAWRATVPGGRKRIRHD